jgi:hypothetical protein
VLGREVEIGELGFEVQRGEDRRWEMEDGDSRVL